MTKPDDMQLIADVAHIAGTNPDIAAAIARANREWSDGTCANLMGTYDYLVTQNPDELPTYLSYLRYLTQVYTPTT